MYLFFLYPICPPFYSSFASYLSPFFCENRITLVENPPVDPDGGLALPSGLFNPTLLKELNQLQFSASFAQTTTTINNNSDVDASTTTPSSTITNADATANQTVPAFSISDFLVPGLQTKVWDDWQGADVLNDYSAFDTQDFSSDLNGNPFQFGLDGLMGNAPIWDNNAIPADQAYDEFVFDLAPSAFETPATVNVADLIVGSNSSASSASAVSPMDLSMPSVDMYQNLALANLYGFTNPTMGADSSSESEVDEDASDDSDQDEIPKVAAAPMATKPAVDAQPTTSIVQRQQPMAPVAATVKREGPNKRRMEEALVARINNDLGPEHMAGLFKILNGSSGQDAEDDEDEEMEVDLSSLDETTLVQVYQYVETCCMQTMRSILAAEERERAAVAAAKAAAAAAEAEAMERQRQRFYTERTPELSPGHSSTSSSSPSPPHPSSGSTPKGRRGTYTKKRSPVHSTSLAMYQAADDLEQDALWAAGHASKSRRKRATHGSSTGVGGGGTDKGRRIQKDMAQQQQLMMQQQQSIENVIVLRATAAIDDDEMEYGEDAEIDVVG
ncbi:hypothetical protein BG015_011879 [Linnemannia schmuckeri]|uniref:NET domain-containing protein n=1 Tax=Linnemannia schmuckeri TaxID=64567 RepID=A0A9P5RSE2_9FUNG|nr:hypothetical protein BG015_011879 [Linnemannia schmuckeri]